MTICNHRWEAPRFEVPGSVDVTHVCMLGVCHKGECRCGCGAMRPPQLDNVES